MPYTHLSAMERGQLQAFLRQGWSQRAIAGALNRHPSNISRELARNGATQGGYDADRAQKRYVTVRKNCRRTISLSHAPLCSYVFDKMTEGWSPEQISGRLWHDHPGIPRMRVSHETIYRTIYTDEKFANALIACLRQRRPRRRKRGDRRPTRPLIPNRIGIEARPAEVDALTRYGDWEGDLVLGANQQGAILTLVERKSLFLCAHKLLSRHAAGAAQAVIAVLEKLPRTWRKTITFDNGSEFARHEQMTQALGAAVYFAHPYAAYERGRNENTNGLLRQYFPKSSNFSLITQRQLKQCVDELNNRPRKKLDYRTPLEVLLQHTVALAT